jgi:hypothetical protein
MRFKTLERIKDFLLNNKNTEAKNNSKQKNVKYVRNKFGFFSLESKENKKKPNNLNK